MPRSTAGTLKQARADRDPRAPRRRAGRRATAPGPPGRVTDRGRLRSGARRPVRCARGPVPAGSTSPPNGHGRGVRRGRGAVRRTQVCMDDAWAPSGVDHRDASRCRQPGQIAARSEPNGHHDAVLAEFAGRAGPSVERDDLARVLAAAHRREGVLEVVEPDPPVDRAGRSAAGRPGATARTAGSPPPGRRTRSSSRGSAGSRRRTGTRRTTPAPRAGSCRPGPPCPPSGSDAMASSTVDGRPIASKA